jgi:hypothetical protein
MKKLLNDKKFLVDYIDMTHPKGKETIRIEIKSKNLIVEVNDDGVVNVTDKIITE